MTTYTNEQLKYIEYNKKVHTKLIACAGSGKTRCIIAKINKLIENKIYSKTEILVLTFSRFTRDDFINKIESYKATNIQIQNVNTIDKFSKQIIDPDGIIDVSLLSYRLMKYLESTEKSELKKNVILNKIKTIFVDESQDLNEIQYRIILALKTKLKIVVNLIGDPNQNIYQFRKSSDKYLTEFEAKTFILTNNFRSFSSIVDFSKHLRPFTDNDVICTKGSNNCKPILSFYENEKILEENIIGILKSAQENNMNLEEFAILSPTRGRMRGCGKSHGLCFISNILYKAGIKFKQFYEESADEITSDGIRYLPEKDHVNVLTYMGSKGLEWKYVILVDADSCLINKNTFDNEKHIQDRYLLYVACSRAIDNMFIFSQCQFRNGEYIFKTNSWFESIPNKLYEVDNYFESKFKYSQPEFKINNRHTNETQLSKIIDRLECHSLDELSNIINFEDKVVKKIYSANYENIIKSPFFVKYIIALFQGMYNIKMKNKMEKFIDIEYALNGDTIVSDVNDDVAEWYIRNKNYIKSWNDFDQDKTIQKSIRDTINNKFDRTINFDKHVISMNGYYQLYILSQKQWIKNLYQKYLTCRNTKQLREILFYLMVIKHGIETHHYYHIKTRGAYYKYILTEYSDIFDDIETYIESHDYKFTSINKIVNSKTWNIIGKIDLIDENNNIWFLKCANEISLRNMIYSTVVDLLHNDYDDYTEKKITLKYINLLKGEEISYSKTFDKNTIETIKDLILSNR